MAGQADPMKLSRSDASLQQSISDLIDTNTPMSESQMDRTLGAAATYQQAGGAGKPGQSATYAINAYAQGDNARVVHEFHHYLEEDSNVAVAVAVIKALTSVIKRSEAATLMGLNDELKTACEALKQCDPTAISLAAGCELFMRYVTRTSALEMVDLSAAKERLIARGETFASISIQARAKIAELGSRFVREDSLLLVHGLSRVSIAILKKAARGGKRFSVIVTEGRPDGTGQSTAKVLEEAGIPCTIILDSGVGAVMERVDMVLVGAEGVVENGGIINKLGTYQIAVVAKALGKPFYVAAESYKFARLYPLNQRDVPVENKHVDFGPYLPKGTMVETPSRDYTPPEFITLLFTDLGVLTPSAVSDELIQLYL